MADEGFNHFSEIADQLDQALSQIVRKTAFDGQAAIQSQIQANGQVDTGFMLNSVYVTTADDSTYGQGADNPPKGAELLPAVETPPDNKTAYIGVGASYGIYQDMGTRDMPARPFVEPGIESVRPGFEAALSAVESKLGGA